MAMSLTDSEVHAVATATLEQSVSEEWKRQRAGRITASNIHDVFTSMCTAEKKNINPTNLICRLMGYTSIPATAAMKHGLSMECHAKQKLKTILAKEHKQASFKDTGLIIYQNETFLAASPDLIMKCSCHGDVLCEIKCPFSIRDQSPNVDNLPYLTNIDGVACLNQNHKYFSQIQAQMGIVGDFKLLFFCVHITWIPY